MYTWGYNIDFQASKIHDEKGDGYYSARVYFQNDYPKREVDGKFEAWLSATPEQNPDESETWIHLEEE